MSFNKRVKTIIKNHSNPSWDQTNVDKLCELIPLKKNHVQYKRLEKVMQNEFLKQIYSIKRIQNPILYEQFKLKAAEQSLFGKIKIRELFHSTASESVDPITENNFDWRLPHRVKFGKGISFSTDPSYANLQSNLNNGWTRAMIVADVIIGKCQIGDNNIVITHDGFDTTVNEEKTVVVKYYDHEFYPKYVIHYETYPIRKNRGERYIDRY